MKNKIKKNCKFCNKEFEAKNPRQEYCDKKCKDNAYYRRKKPLEEKMCENCEDMFFPKHNNTKCCSKHCSEELHRIKAKKRIYKFRKQHPDLAYAKELLGSRGTTSSSEPYFDGGGMVNAKKESTWLKNEKKRLGL